MLKKKSKNIERLFLGCILAGLLVYMVSIIVLNYNGRVFYNFDINADSIVSKLMWEQKTLFPDGWIFGNQYYVVATPVLAALLYPFIQDTFYSMATASCLMMLFSALSFYYCFKFFASRKEMLCGLFCLMGGTIIGSGAGSYINGLQVFYTMASYYSCYLIGILLTLGVYLRLKNNIPCNIATVSAVLIFNFALNMHSLRQMLVSCIPILVIEAVSLFFDFIKNKKLSVTLKNNIKSTVFTVLTMLSALGGTVLIRQLDILSAPIIGDVSLTYKPSEIFLNFKETLYDFVYYAGILYYQKGIKYFPLTAISIFLIAVVFVALIIMIKKKDTGAAACVAYFSIISLFGVFVVGVFLLRVRTIYFFVWYLLVASCAVYLAKELKATIRYLFLVMLLVAGAGNYAYNFGLDTIDYIRKDGTYQQIAETLEESDINRVYISENMRHCIAAYVDEKINVVTVEMDYEKESGYAMTFIPYLQQTDILENKDYSKSVIMFNDSLWSEAERKAGTAYVEELKSKLDLFESFEVEDEGTYCFYKIKEQIVADLS